MTLEFAAKLIFWSSIAALFYTYAGYPMLLLLVSTVRPKRVRRGPYQPSVSVIITAYNEERDLHAKLENTLALDYPGELVEIIVASDCSTDRTDEIALQFADRDVRLHRQVERLGKTAAQNAAVERAHGEIIVFSDATSHYESSVLRAMMPNFADSSVGCVAGRLIYVDPEDSRVGLGARSYWAYETFLKKHESRAVSLIGASGCLYAVRKSAYVPLYHEACSDFIIATQMIDQGLRTIYEPEAVCIEQTNLGSDKELKMRVRVIAQTFAELWRHRAVINPLNSGFYGVQLFSHKVLRYLVPLFLVAMLPASAVLANDSPFYSIVLAAQLGFYMTAFLSWILERTGVYSSLLALPQYFVLANVASLVGLYKFLRGERYAVWQPIRQSTSDATNSKTDLAVDLNQGGNDFSQVADNIQTNLTAADSNKEKAPLVSVIIPAYNVAGYIRETLASVFAQTLKDFEVIVINDGSSDTEELECALQPYLNRIIYIKQQNRGPGGARNAGIRRARGRFIALLDADDLWLSDYLAQQLSALEEEPALDLIYSDALLLGKGRFVGQSFMRLFPSRGPVTLDALLEQRCVVITSCVVARRQSLIDSGLFDENYLRSEDFDLWVRLAYGGARLAYQRKVLAQHRKRPTSLAADLTRMQESAMEVYENLTHKLALTASQLQSIETQIGKYQAELALASGKCALAEGNHKEAAKFLGRACDLRRATGQSALKLRFVLSCLNLAPRALRRAYQLRERLVTSS